MNVSHYYRSYQKFVTIGNVRFGAPIIFLSQDNSAKLYQSRYALPDTLSAWIVSSVESQRNSSQTKIE